MPQTYEIKITLTPDLEQPGNTVAQVHIPDALPGTLMALGIQQLCAAFLAQAPDDISLQSVKLGLYQDLSRLPNFKKGFEGFFES